MLTATEIENNFIKLFPVFQRDKIKPATTAQAKKHIAFFINKHFIDLFDKEFADQIKPLGVTIDLKKPFAYYKYSRTCAFYYNAGSVIVAITIDGMYNGTGSSYNIKIFPFVPIKMFYVLHAYHSPIRGAVTRLNTTLYTNDIVKDVSNLLKAAEEMADLIMDMIKANKAVW